MGNLYHMESALQSIRLKEMKIDSLIVAASGDERAYNSISEMLRKGFQIELTDRLTKPKKLRNGKVEKENLKGESDKEGEEKKKSEK